jgi:hypothetical protein
MSEGTAVMPEADAIAAASASGVKSDMTFITSPIIRAWQVWLTASSTLVSGTGVLPHQHSDARR